MVRREEVFFKRELEMRKEQENFKREQTRNEAFSRTLAKEKGEQDRYKVKLRRREEKVREEEEKLQVDQRKLDNLTKRQQKLLVRAQSTDSSSGSRASRRSIGSRRSNQSGRSSFSGRGSCNSWNSRLSQFLHLGLSSDFSRMIDPKVEVSYISGHQQTNIFQGQNNSILF